MAPISWIGDLFGSNHGTLLGVLGSWRGQLLRHHSKRYGNRNHSPMHDVRSMCHSWLDRHATAARVIRKSAIAAWPALGGRTNVSQGTMCSIKVDLNVFKVAKCSARASRSWRNAGLIFASTRNRYLSKHSSATLLAEGKRLGGAIDNPAPHTTTRRFPSMEASNCVFTSGVTLSCQVIQLFLTCNGESTTYCPIAIQASKMRQLTLQDQPTCFLASKTDTCRLRYLLAEPDTLHDAGSIGGDDVTAHVIFCSISKDDQKRRSALAIPSDEVSSVQCGPGVGGRSEPKTPDGVVGCKISKSMIRTLGALHRFIRIYLDSEALWRGSLVRDVKNTPRLCDAHFTFHRNF